MDIAICSASINMYIEAASHSKKKRENAHRASLREEPKRAIPDLISFLFWKLAYRCNPLLDLRVVQKTRYCFLGQPPSTMAHWRHVNYEIFYQTVVRLDKIQPDLKWPRHLFRRRIAIPATDYCLLRLMTHVLRLRNGPVVSMVSVNRYVL